MADTLIRLTQTTLDAESNKLTSLADGTVASDAINKGQLDAAVSGVVTLANFVIDETPSGVINGSNTIFTLAFTPTLMLGVYINGQKLIDPGDYSISGVTITFVKAPKSSGTGDKIRVSYLK